MSGFAPGDVVVCVDAQARQCLTKRHRGNGLVVGAIYRVHRSGSCRELTKDSSECDCAGIITTDGSSSLAERFRKIDPATDEFTEQMRALRPVRTPLQAGCR